MAALGDRMKRYEQVTRAVLPLRTFTIVRVDGRAFHTLLRDAVKPFDHGVIEAMGKVAEALCAEIDGAICAYTQSDEVSVLLSDQNGRDTQPWFNGVVQKMASVSASVATVAFNREFVPDEKPATFDSRVFTIPDRYEVMSYFQWRQRDAVRNSISMAAQAVFPHSSLQHVNSDGLQDKLWKERGINWNDYPPECKRGQLTGKVSGEREVPFIHKGTGVAQTAIVTKTWWQTTGAPMSIAAWLDEELP